MYEDPVEAINKITRECMLIAAVRVAARYSALNFYQQRQEEPLTQEEMNDIAAGVDGEIGKDTLDLFKVFTDTED